jgi:NAD(P)H dehydrogenase (quinone)
MIVVTGATGNLARLTVQRLVERVDAAEVVATSRTPEKVSDLPVTVRAADFDDPDALVRTFDGADRVFIVSLHPLPERSRLQANAINAAAKAGVGHIVYTSFSRAGEPGNPVSIVPDHRLAEQALISGGVPFTALRFNMWPSMLLMMGTAKQAVDSGALMTNSGDGRVAYVTREDCAAVSAAVLATGSNQGELLEVSGPAAVSDAELAATLTEVAGRPVAVNALPDDDAKAAYLANGLPEPYAKALVANGVARRNGWYETTTHAVSRLTGQTPTSLADFLILHRAEFLAS